MGGTELDTGARPHGPLLPSLPAPAALKHTRTLALTRSCTCTHGLQAAGLPAWTSTMPVCRQFCRCFSCRCLLPRHLPAAARHALSPSFLLPGPLLSSQEPLVRGRAGAAQRNSWRAVSGSRPRSSGRLGGRETRAGMEGVGDRVPGGRARGQGPSRSQGSLPTGPRAPARRRRRAGRGRGPSGPLRRLGAARAHFSSFPCAGLGEASCPGERTWGKGPPKSRWASEWALGS